MLDTESSKLVGTQTTLPDFLGLVTTGAIQVGTCNQLTLAVEDLEDYGADIRSYEDYIAVGPSQPLSTLPNQKIHIRDLLKVPMASGTAGIGYYFTGALAFFTDYGPGTSYLAVASGDSSNTWYGAAFNTLLT